MHSKKMQHLGDLGCVARRRDDRADISRAAFQVAAATDWIDLQRLRVVPMVVLHSFAAAIRAREFAGWAQQPFANRDTHIAVCYRLGESNEGFATKTLPGAPFLRPLIRLAATGANAVDSPVLVDTASDESRPTSSERFASLALTHAVIHEFRGTALAHCHQAASAGVGASYMSGRNS